MVTFSDLLVCLMRFYFGPVPVCASACGSVGRCSSCMRVCVCVYSFAHIHPLQEASNLQFAEAHVVEEVFPYFCDYLCE